MKYLVQFLLICMFASPVLADEPSIELKDLKSPLARKAVETFSDRIEFLEQSMREHVETATRTLRESLSTALKQAAMDGDLEETERISKFLQADVAPGSGNRVVQPSSRNASKAAAEIKRVKERLAIAEPLMAILHDDTEFIRSIVGKSYLVPTQKRNRLRRWTFNADGTHSVDNRIAGRWAVIGKRTILTKGSSRDNVDMFRFSSDGSTVDVRYIGSGDKSQWKDQGSLAR